METTFRRFPECRNEGATVQFAKVNRSHRNHHMFLGSSFLAKELAVSPVLGVAWCSTHQSTLVALKATLTSDNGKERTISLKGTVSNLQKKLDDLHSHLSNSEDYRRWFLHEFTSRDNPATKETLQYCCHKPMLRNSFG